MKKQFLLISILLLIFQSSTYGQGTRYTGPYTPSGAIVWGGVSNKVISGLSFTNIGKTSIELDECSNITIQNCKFSKSAFKAITAENVQNLTIVDCVFDSINGIYVGGYSKNPFNNGTSSGVKILHNYFKNTIGNILKNHSVQFGCVNGGGGNQVDYNSFEQFAGQCNVDDMVSIYSSNGALSDSIEINNNWFRGGDGTVGSGIMIGDTGGSYIVVRGNIIVNIVACGIGNAGANHTVIENNIILQQKSFSVGNNGVGIYQTNFNPTVLDCSNNTERNNRAYYVLNNGNINNFGGSSNCGTISGLSTNISDPTLNVSILPQDISRAKAAVTTGTTTGTTITPSVGYKIYPNPVFGQSMVVTLDTLSNEKIAIYNLSGQRIIEQTLTSSRTEINTSNLNTGIYLVMISDNNNKTIEVRKILVTRN